MAELSAPARTRPLTALAQDVRFARPDSTPRALYEAAIGARRAEAQPASGLGLLAPRGRRGVP